jgi:predicted RNA-binding Zn ribbon-like protein
VDFIAGNLALDFINTVGYRSGDRREYLANGAALSHWARRAGILAEAAEIRVTRRQMMRVRAIREELHRLFHLLAAGGAPSAAVLAPLNARLAGLAPKRQLSSAEGGVVWVWTGASNDPGRVLGPVLSSAADLLASGSYHRVRECRGEQCGWLFLDRSHAGRRVWCSMADCGNREKGRRHYQRVRTASHHGSVGGRTGRRSGIRRIS